MRCNWTWERMMKMTEKLGVERVVCENCQGLGTVTHNFTGINAGEVETVAVEVRCRGCKGRGSVVVEAVGK